MKNLNTVVSYLVCLMALGATIWIASVNFAEISDRASGHYTFYSQRATLSDDEAVLYFSGWTILFLIVCFLSIKNLIKERSKPAIIYGCAVVLLILLSTYVDTLFYHKLV